MANHVTYTISGKDYELKLTAKKTIDLETVLDRSVTAALSDIDKMSVAAEIIAAAMPDGSHEERLNLAYEIYDSMTENGKTYRDYIYLVYDILVSAGFLAGGTVEKQKELQAAQEAIEEAAHNQALKLIEEKTQKIKGSQS